ncbi:MAG TPA: hypothetical protein VN734_10460 [Acidobacteriaceae bacterium]|nr:hypothetical protein [Acidobacteriaceae bacterium]
MSSLLRLAILPLSLLSVMGSAQSLPAPEIALPVGVPLRIRITHTAHLRVGTPVTGVLTEPVYLHDHLVLPRDTTVLGVVAGFAHVDRKLRTQALLNGDVTPLHDPVVDFNRLQLPGSSQQISISSRGVIRDTQLVRFLLRRNRPTYIQQAEDMARAQIKSVHDTFLTPGRTDRALRLLYSQLPYHPQRIWAGTGFIADLDAPLDLPSSHPAPAALASSASLNSITVSARLITPLDSRTSKAGDTVTATITRPVFDSDHNLLVPEGATLEGVVTRAKPARRLGRNGELRFGFRGLADEAGTTTVDGNVTGAAGAKAENLTVDDEGNVRANPGKGKVLAPLLLAYTAALGADDDGGVGQSVVGSNGFGLVARLIAFSNNKNVSAGFGMYALAKSVYFRYIDRGHQVTFPRDTEVEVQLVSRTVDPAR